MNAFIVIFLGAALVSFLATPCVRLVARRLPRAERGAARVPGFGGAAILAGALAGTAFSGMLLGWDSFEGVFLPHEPLILLGCGLVVCLLGALDDLIGLRPATRLLVEAAAAVPLVLSGYLIDSVATPWFAHLDLGLLAYPVTVLWIVAIANAFNLIDGMDGLLTTVGGVALLGCVAVGLITGQVGGALLALSLAAALVGFIWWNWHPARIILGDSGSLPTGFLIAALTLKVSRTPGAVIGLQIPLLLCALPIAEMLLTLARRHVSGKPYFSGDRRHLHHVLHLSGLTVPQVVIALGATSVVFGAVAILSVFWRNPLFLLLIVFLLAAALQALRRLRYLEFRVLLDRFVRLLVRRGRGGLPASLAAARAGEAVRGATSPAMLRDGLRAAVVEGRFTFLALEFSPSASRRLGGGRVDECKNEEAERYRAELDGRPYWLFSAETPPAAGPSELCSIRFSIPLPSDGHLGRLVCECRFAGTGRAPTGQDIRTYLGEPLTEVLLVLVGEPEEEEEAGPARRSGDKR